MSKSAALASSHRCYYSFTRKQRANSCCSSPSNTHTHTDVVREAENSENERVQAVTVNINGDSSCGINAAHLGGQSGEETADLRGSDEEQIQVGREETEGRRKYV